VLIVQLAVTVPVTVNELVAVAAWAPGASAASTSSVASVWRGERWLRFVTASPQSFGSQIMSQPRGSSSVRLSKITRKT
jgi:hypothetical protein